MKMIVRGILLGSAAGMSAVTAVQAADLPVKAKPVEYVKICSLYGDGFYYVPGTETCVRFGGTVRYDADWNTTGGNGQPTYAGLAGTQTRESFPFEQRARGDFDFDTRTSTAYGTLRAFVRLRIEVLNGQSDSTTSPALPRSFVQWAGWTFGRVKSLSDVPAFDDDGARILHQIQNVLDTGANGNTEVSYSYELGNGMSLHLGAGERRAKSVTNLSTAAWALPGVNPASSIAGQIAPNPFVAFKINQAWGRWDTSVTANSVRANYYTAPTPGFVGCVGANAGTTWCDHPSDDWGFAVATGAIINMPWIAPGDIFGIFGQYGVGATAYGTGANLTSPGLYARGNNLALGPVTEAVYLNGRCFELTTSWTAGAYFTHYWSQQFSTTVFGTHSEISYNNTVKSGRWFCGPSAANGGLAAAQGIAIAAGDPCDPDFNFSTV